MEKEMTYDEYLAELNNVAIGKSMKNMIEVPSMDEAIKAGEALVKTLKKNMNLPKGRSKKVTYAIAQVKSKDKNWIVALCSINGAHVLMRATDLETQQYYVPSEVWMIVTVEDPETGEEIEDLAQVFALASSGEVV